MIPSRLLKQFHYACPNHLIFILQPPRHISNFRHIWRLYARRCMLTRVACSFGLYSSELHDLPCYILFRVACFRCCMLFAVACSSPLHTFRCCMFRRCMLSGNACSLGIHALRGCMSSGLHTLPSYMLFRATCSRGQKSLIV